jgi:hypothetical protein
MTILTTLPNGGNLFTSSLTTYCSSRTEPFFQRIVCIFGRKHTVPLVGGVEKKALAFSRQTEPKRLAFGETTETIFAECFQAGSCKLARSYATKEPGIGLRKTRLPYTPIRLGCVASIQNVGRGADCLTRRYTTNLLNQGRWLVRGAMPEIQRSAE